LILKNKIYYYLISTIAILIFVLILVTVRYREYKNETICLAKKIDTLLLKNKKALFTNSVVEINIIQQLDWDNYISGLYATSTIYFCSIKKGNNEILLKDLSKSSTICKSWTSNSKKKYVEHFSTYNKETNQTSIKKMYDCALEGINIVDMVCLNIKDEQ